MSYPDRDVAEGVRAIARDDFFDAIEISQIAGRRQEGGGKEASGAVSSAGLLRRPAEAAGGQELNPNDTDEEGRRRAEATLLEGHRRGGVSGSWRHRLPGGKMGRRRQRSWTYAQLLKTTGNLCEYAASKGMMVELEVFDYDMDKAALIGPPPTQPGLPPICA